MLLVNKLTSYTALSIIASLCITSSVSKPVQLEQQATLQHNHHIIPYIKEVPNKIVKKRRQTIDELDSYYTTILDDVIESTINEILETAPETYLTIHELQYTGREYCRVSIHDFMMVLSHQLNHEVKYSLIASVRPLVEKYNDDNIIEFNHDISQQLGLVLNPKQLSHQIIQEIYQPIDHNHLIVRIWKMITDKLWVETKQHERNESIAIETWLRSWLMDIEFTLQDEFDFNIHSLFLTR